MAGTHRRTPVLRRSVAAAVILAAGSAGGVLALRDAGSGPVARPSFTDTFPATLGPSVIAGPSVSVGPAPVHTRRYVLASSAVRGADTVSAPVSPSVSTVVPPPTSPLVRSSTRVAAPVSSPVPVPTTPPETTGPPSPTVSASASALPDGSATWTLQQWLDWLRHHRKDPRTVAPSTPVP